MKGVDSTTGKRIEKGAAEIECFDQKINPEERRKKEKRGKRLCVLTWKEKSTEKTKEKVQ